MRFQPNAHGGRVVVSGCDDCPFATPENEWVDRQCAITGTTCEPDGVPHDCLLTGGTVLVTLARGR